MIDLSKLDIGLAINRAVADVLNAAVPDAPALYWSIYYAPGGPMLTAALDDFDELGMQRWARALGLSPVDATFAGTRAVGGSAAIDHQRYQVRLWCITDRAAYEADHAQYLAALRK